MDLKATALEIPFSNDPAAPATAPGASLQSLPAMRVRSGAFPADTAARTGPVFPLPSANRNRAGRRRLQFSLAGGKLFLVRAKLFAPPVPFASNARRSGEIFVDLPAASRSIDRVDCLDWEYDVGESTCDRADLGPLAAGPSPIQCR